jgi:hypothetical protein
MKRIFFLFTIIFLLLNTVAAYASQETSENPENKINSVDQIKNKVASRVAELKLVEKKGLVGTVEKVDNNQIRIIDLNNKVRIIDVDELTNFSSNDNDDFGLSDISKGSKISAVGLYNKESERLLARYITETNIPVFLSGVISDKDSKNYTITLSTEDNKDFKVDIEKITKSYELTDNELEEAGFTKIEASQNALVIGYPDPKEENRLSATKILVIPNLPQNPKINFNKKAEQSVSSPASPTPQDE